MMYRDWFYSIFRSARVEKPLAQAVRVSTIGEEGGELKKEGNVIRPVVPTARPL